MPSLNEDGFIEASLQRLRGGGFLPDRIDPERSESMRLSIS